MELRLITTTLALLVFCLEARADSQTVQQVSSRPVVGSTPEDSKKKEIAARAFTLGNRERSVVYGYDPKILTEHLRKTSAGASAGEISIEAIAPVAVDEKIAKQAQAALSQNPDLCAGIQKAQEILDTRPKIFLRAAVRARNSSGNMINSLLSFDQYPINSMTIHVDISANERFSCVVGNPSHVVGQSAAKECRSYCERASASGGAPTPDIRPAAATDTAI